VKDIQFTTDYLVVLEKINRIDPILYSKTRNYINGAVTYLSPYISRGVISTKTVLTEVLKKGFTIPQIEAFAKELVWRDYFQRVAQVHDVNSAIKQEQHPIANYGIPLPVMNASTGIKGIDHSIDELIETGYMHNHCRMYLASLVCNIAQSHWLQPARWLYYYLLDGDWASNACSWQWVAGANSSKKYYANQENINKYTNTNQSNTILDLGYEDIENRAIPEELLKIESVELTTELPEQKEISISDSLPTFIYNYYNLDPLWHRGTVGNRVLLLDPNFFSQYPISKKCMDFVIALSKNIPDIQFYIG
jgi:deoxyribodipyrimidine photo-lyase